MKISAIIPAFRVAPYLNRAVDSLLATHYDDLEIVIVEDGSKDQTLRIAREIEDRHPQKVRVLTHPGCVNRGVSATRNLGIQQSTGELICFLDADDYVHPCRFESAVEIFTRRGDVDGIYQMCEMEYSTVSARERRVDQSPLFGIREALTGQPLLDSLLNLIPWHTNAVTFRRELLDKTGLFDPRLRIAEDCHLWLRMAYVGNIQPGDLTRPVAVYARRDDSAYQPGIANRIHAIRAITSFYSWTRNHPGSLQEQRHLRSRIADYILRGIEQARIAQHHSHAWTMALKSAFWFAPVCCERRWYGNILRMCVGR